MVLGIINDLMNCSHVAMDGLQFFHYRDLILHNLDGRVDSHFTGSKRQPYLLMQSTGIAHLCNVSREALTMLNAVHNASSVSVNAEDGAAPAPAPKPEGNHNYVSVFCIDGPMTRCGAECTYGSKDMRDLMMKDSLDPDCAGFIFYCDTPGGMADCLVDYRQAIDFAHEHGKCVDMLIDGYCASCGCFLSAMCDHVWFTAPKNEIGSIGMYACWFSLPDRSENKVTSEVYHEVYASQSTEKNSWKRLADGGDYSSVQKDLDDDLAETIASLKADRPSITDEQCHGAMYRCGDVIGTLVDGQSDMNSIAESIISNYQQNSNEPAPADVTPDDNQPSPDDAPVIDRDPHEEPDDDESRCDPDKQHCDNSPVSPVSCGQSQEPNINRNMKQYTAISSALGYEADVVMESDAEGLLTLQPEQADAIETILNARDQNVSVVENQRQQIEALNSQLSSLNSQLSSLNSQLETKDSQLSALNSQLEAKDSQLSTLNSQLNDLQQRNADLQTTVNDLNNAQGAQPKVGQAPANNGKPAPQKPHIVSSSTYDPHLTAAENFELYQARRQRMANR